MIGCEGQGDDSGYNEDDKCSEIDRWRWHVKIETRDDWKAEYCLDDDRRVIEP